MAADGGFKYFHYSSPCAHRVANLYKNAANAPFRGWGDILDATKSNGKFILAFSQVVKFLAAGFGFKYFHYSGCCAHRVASLRKMLQMHLSGVGGTPWMQPKSNGKFLLAFSQVVKFLSAGFGFKYFHYSGCCAHRVASLCKNAANAPFRGGGTPWMQPKSNGKFILAFSQGRQKLNYFGKS